MLYKDPAVSLCRHHMTGSSSDHAQSCSSYSSISGILTCSREGLQSWILLYVPFPFHRKIKLKKVLGAFHSLPDMIYI